MILFAKYLNKKDTTFEVTLLENHSVNGFVLVRYARSTVKLDIKDFEQNFRLIDA